jgi:hypothetical protein
MLSREAMSWVGRERLVDKDASTKVGSRWKSQFITEPQIRPNRKIDEGPQA